MFPLARATHFEDLFWTDSHVSVVPGVQRMASKRLPRLPPPALSEPAETWLKARRPISLGKVPSENPNPTTKIGSKMGGEFTYPKMIQLVLNHGNIHMAMIFLGVCNARRATNLVTEVCNGGPCYAGL